MIAKFLRKLIPNTLDLLLQKAQKKGDKKILLFWNRGLGDIALGLYAIVHRIREFIPDAEITFLTRANLYEGFVLLGDVHVRIVPKLKRGDPFNRCFINDEEYDLIIENPDPTKWVSWQLGKLTPKLCWQVEWDDLWTKFPLDPSETYIGAHVQTETSYGFRDWPAASWHRLFEKITADGKKVLLFGFAKEPKFDIEGVIDLRGDTPLFELLSIIKNRCQALIVPDSGVSSMAYFLHADFPIKHISLWGEAHMGILKQNVPSPNKLLHHIPILGKDKNIAMITPDEVYAKL